jgi:hypothetical protein
VVEHLSIYEALIGARGGKGALDNKRWIYQGNNSANLCSSNNKASSHEAEMGRIEREIDLHSVTGINIHLIN